MLEKESFLLQKDARVHTHIVNPLMNVSYLQHMKHVLSRHLLNIMKVMDCTFLLKTCPGGQNEGGNKNYCGP